jgi:hypothetical protein
VVEVAAVSGAVPDSVSALGFDFVSTFDLAFDFDSALDFDLAFDFDLSFDFDLAFDFDFVAGFWSAIRPPEAIDLHEVWGRRTVRATAGVTVRPTQTEAVLQ